VQYVVTVMPKALRQLGAIVSWWRSNRPEAPALAEHEILAALESLDQHPDRGFLAPGGPEQRRMLVTPRTRFLIVYRVRPRAKRVEILEIRR
jgi:plasmid stabilization system protein ParE